MDKTAISSTIGPASPARENSSTIGLGKISFRLCADKDLKVEQVEVGNN
jgi:hypothetical protein